jgi:hypothetical protein
MKNMEKMKKTNIKMRVNPEQSKKVQEIFFRDGTFWGLENYARIDNLEKPFLFYKSVAIYHSDCIKTFVDSECEEVDADLFIRTNGTCIENPNEHLDRLDDIVDEAIKEDSHNAHYKAQKIDTITRCKANMTLEQQKAICIFQIDRYTHREKGQNLSDIKKIRDYLDWLEEIEKELENER